MQPTASHTDPHSDWDDLSALWSDKPQKPLRERHLTFRTIIPDGVRLHDRSVKHRYKKAPTAYLLGYLVIPNDIYQMLKQRGKASDDVQRTLVRYLKWVKEQTKMTWGSGLRKVDIDGKEMWLFYIAKALCREDILAIDQSYRDGLRRLIGATEEPMLIIYHHPKSNTPIAYVPLSALSAGKQIPLREYTLVCNAIVPDGADLNDRSIQHRYKQSRPTYLFGYLLSPQKVYEMLRQSGKASKTMTATLKGYLGFIKKHTGITWGNGLKKIHVEEEEVWIIYTAQSLRKEEIFEIDQPHRDAFRHLIGATEDPMLITYEHPKRFIC
ncbi:uncharacterized protein SCHCODRAFT_02672453 [Schizophyllum commune H4-8]|nr:uncharacterized protein SCHCODRAFT_02672453 [Schizophyllum commune H4-8]KAI5887329.1 hypothetical protein SCHCODRAFT_02672453 [Schizophyllum commune H4-8]